QLTTPAFPYTTLFRSGHFGAALREKHVDLAPHAEAPRQVDARLHGEPDPRDERPGVGRLEVVEMRTRAVQIAVDRVAGAVHEELDRKSTRLNSSHEWI